MVAKQRRRVGLWGWKGGHLGLVGSVRRGSRWQGWFGGGVRTRATWDVWSVGVGRGGDRVAGVILRWLWAGGVSVPVAILLHEFGHYVTYRGLGVAGVTLRHSSVTWQGMDAFWGLVSRGAHEEAATIVPLWVGAAGAAMGPVATYVVVVACCCACWRGFGWPEIVAVGYLSQVRIVAGAWDVGKERFLGRDVVTGTDEERVAAATGVSVELLVVCGLLLFVVSGIWLIRYLPAGRRVAVGVAMTGGMAGGLLIYLGYLGPWLLP